MVTSCQGNTSSASRACCSPMAGCLLWNMRQQHFLIGPMKLVTMNLIEIIAVISCKTMTLMKARATWLLALSNKASRSTCDPSVFVNPEICEQRGRSFDHPLNLDRTPT